MFDEMNCFLKMEPVVPSPFPAWMRRSRHETQVLGAKTLKEFCELVAGGEEDSPDNFQIQLLRGWIVKVAQQAESEAAFVKVCEGSDAAALSRFGGRLQAAS